MVGKMQLFEENYVPNSNFIHEQKHIGKFRINVGYITV